MSDTGWVTGSTFSNDSSYGTYAWSNPSNAELSDDSYTEATFSGVNDTNYLKATNFGFSIPTGATIDGVIVSVEMYCPAGVVDTVVKLVKGGSVSGNNNSVGNTWAPSFPDEDEATHEFGGSSDLWGLTLSEVDIESSNFGVVFACGEPTDAAIAKLDQIKIKVYYTESSETPTVGVKYPLPRY
jgi:hypothetical protein